MVIVVWLARKITSEVIMHRGYIKLWRCIQDNNLWTDEPFDKARAWIDLVMLANYKDATIQRRGIKGVKLELDIVNLQTVGSGVLARFRGSCKC
jgi:hypothetical protein